jgi:hypothetical protein
LIHKLQPKRSTQESGDFFNAMDLDIPLGNMKQFEDFVNDQSFLATHA